MADEERRLRATLEVRQEGNAGAPKELAEDLREVGSSADEVRAKLRGVFDGVNRQLEQTQAAVRDAKEALDDKGRSWDEVATKVARGAGVVLAAAGTLKTFYSGTREAVEGLKDFGINIDEIVQDSSVGEWFDSIAESIAGVGSAASDNTDELRNLQKVLSSMGVGTAGKGLEELRELLESNAKELKNTKDEVAAADKAYEKWAESLGVSKEKLDEAAQQLAEFAEKFAEQNEQLGSADFAALLGPQVQKLLDQYQRLGQEAPPALQAVADAWGVVPKAAEQAAAASEAAAKKISQALVGEFGKTSEEVHKIAAEVVKALGSIDVGKLELVDPKQFEEAKKQVQELVNQFRVLGEKIPPDLEKAAGALDVFLTGLDVEKVEVFAGAATDLSQQTTRIIDVFDEAGNKIGTSVETVSDAAAAYLNLSEEQRKSVDAAREAGRAQLQAGVDAGSAAKPLGEQAAAAEDSAKKTGSAAEEAEKLALQQDAAAASAAKMAESLTASAAAISESATKVEALSKVDLDPLISKMERLAKAIEGAASAVDRLDSGGGGGGAAPPASAPPPDGGSGGGGGGG